MHDYYWLRERWFYGAILFCSHLWVDSFYEIIIRDAFESFLYSTDDYEKWYDWISKMERTNDRMLKNKQIEIFANECYT